MVKMTPGPVAPVRVVSAGYGPRAPSFPPQVPTCLQGSRSQTIRPCPLLASGHPITDRRS
jgi:hypothetical protein